MRFATVASHDYPRIEGDLSQKGDRIFLGQLAATATLEDIGYLPAVWADKATHVFNNPEQIQIELVAETDRLLNIDQSDVLRRGDHNGTGAFAEQLCC